MPFSSTNYIPLQWFGELGFLCDTIKNCKWALQYLWDFSEFVRSVKWVFQKLTNWMRNGDRGKMVSTTPICLCPPSGQISSHFSIQIKRILPQKKSLRKSRSNQVLCFLHRMIVMSCHWYENWSFMWEKRENIDQFQWF